MDGINQVTISGNLVEDPELDHSKNGKAYSSFTIAVTTYFAGKENTNFIPVQVWGNSAEALCENKSKGGGLEVVGSIDVSNYEDDLGNKKTFTKVLARKINFLGGSRSDGKDLAQVGPDEEEVIPF